MTLIFEPKADRPPPPDEVGAIAWIRANLFKDVPNALMTILGLYLAVTVTSWVLDWAIFNAVWEAENRRECLDAVGRAGACWPGVVEWLPNLIYGLYPKDAVWRINAGFLVLILWMVPLWMPRVKSKVAIGLAAVMLYPLLASYFFLGGEKGVVWTALIAAGLWGFVWVWATALCERATDRSVGEWIGLRVAGPDNETAQKRARQATAAALFVACFALVAAWSLEEVRTQLWGGLFLTLVISGIGITFSLPAGILLALGRRSDLPVIAMLSTIFIELFRSVPLITILFMFNTMLPLFMPEGTDVNQLVRAIVAVCLFAAAYMAEVIRGGLQAIPKGQYEAAASLGLGYWQTTTQVVMPQALKIMIPTIVGNFIGLFKDTTLVSIIGLFDLMNMARAVGEDTDWLGLFIEPFFLVSLIYFVFCFAMSSYSIGLEKKLSRGRDR
ncbi:ABC transporter permease subunit [Roseibacterium sp. SDUM158017]|uniref:amino acid ABC transporter permease n=1 Tax=Roseicyclus salinarum TaxID=3036773 RepID=UPI00241590CA|nr:ABC transporter permease subunit [Roseibacterium sp. SDUM158017]MDG4650326.1 ABC transporter permease subunit [Roseibacterium sp. SDUM158017]